MKSGKKGHGSIFNGMGHVTLAIVFQFVLDVWVMINEGVAA